MDLLQKYIDETDKIKHLILKGEYTKAIFDCNNIKNEIIRLSLNKEKELKNNSILLLEFKNKYNKDDEIIEIINNLNNIVKKYDYEHQDIFSLKDAKNMYYNTLEMIKIFSEERK